MNVCIFKQVSPSLKGPVCNFTLYMGQCSFLLTVLAFRCPLSLYSQIDIGCRIKIVAVFVSIHFLGTNPPTQIQEVCQRHLSKTNSHLHQMQATKNNQSTQRGVQEIQQPQTNANKTFSSQRLQCLATSLLHHGPENRSKPALKPAAKLLFVLLQVRMVENRSCNRGCKCLFPVLQKARCFALTLLSPHGFDLLGMCNTSVKLTAFPCAKTKLWQS